MNIVDKYNESAAKYAQSRVGTEDKAQLAKLMSLVAPGAKVLDAGCAAGRDTRILKDRGFDVVGSDLAEKLLDIAKKDNPDIVFVQADIRKLPFADHSFDAVWASAVLHHLNKLEMTVALKEFWRVLAPGGVVYVHTKAGQGVLRTQESAVLGKTREFELLTAKELELMLHEVGFVKLSLETNASKSRGDLLWLNTFYKRPA